MDFGEQGIDSRVQFQPEKGLPIRSSLASDDVIMHPVGGMILRDKQKDQLEAFYKSSCARGTASFTWINPWPNAGTITFGFHTRPQYELFQPALFRYDASPSETPYGQYQRLWYASFVLVRAPWFPA
jgi:hypothetical protein